MPVFFFEVFFFVDFDLAEVADRLPAFLDEVLDFVLAGTMSPLFVGNPQEATLPLVEEALPVVDDAPALRPGPI